MSKLQTESAPAGRLSGDILWRCFGPSKSGCDLDLANDAVLRVLLEWQ